MANIHSVKRGRNEKFLTKSKAVLILKAFINHFAKFKTVSCAVN